MNFQENENKEYLDILNWFKGSKRFTDSEINLLKKKMIRLQTKAWQEGYRDCKIYNDPMD